MIPTEKHGQDLWKGRIEHDCMLSLCRVKVRGDWRPCRDRTKTPWQISLQRSDGQEGSHSTGTRQAALCSGGIAAICFLTLAAPDCKAWADHSIRG